MAEKLGAPYYLYTDRRHLTLNGVDSSLLNDIDFFNQTFTKLIVEDLNVELIGDMRSHPFEASEKGVGNGISGVGILGASNFGIHTWPELNRLTANFEFCSKVPELDNLDQHMLERFIPISMESEQKVTLEDGSILLKDVSYTNILGHQPSNIYIYDGLITNEHTVARTSRMLAALEGRAKGLPIIRSEETRPITLTVTKAI